MREIFIDLSADSYLQKVEIFGGYSGEHNESLLRIKLPNRMLSDDFLYYYFKFETDCGEEIKSIPISYTQINNSIIETTLCEQLTQKGNLKVNVVASNEKIIESPSRIAMTNTIVLKIKQSPNGKEIFIDPSATELQLLQLIDERVLRDLQNLGELAVDQTYNPESENAQSGKAVADAIATKADNSDILNMYYIIDVDEPLEQSELVRGYHIGTTGTIYSESTNYCVAVYPIDKKIKEIVVNAYHSSAPLCTMAFYKADTFEECTPETLIGTPVLYTKNVDTLFTIPSGATMLCVSIYKPESFSSSVTVIKRFEAIVSKHDAMIEDIAKDCSSMVEELRDIRIGLDGEIYDSAGDAVREQINSLKADVYYEKECDEPLPELERVVGQISATTGETNAGSYRVATFPINNKIKEIVVNGYHVAEHLCTMGFYKANTIEECNSETLIGTPVLYTKKVDTLFTIPSGATLVCVSVQNDTSNIKVNITKKLDNIANQYEENRTVIENTFITVGENGDCATLNEALTKMSERYPVYKSGGIGCEVKILSGTTINEQICVVGTDLSYIKITSEDAEVPVNVDGFNSKGLNTHDLRSNAGAFFGGENGARLPTIACLFKVAQNTNNIAVVGYFANRGSSGLVLSNCGFDGFNDGVIANNEASVTIREGIARNMTRWGIHARHNGEISARSANLTNCGDTAAYADRIGDLDVREAILDGSKVALMGYHTSRINANGCNMTNVGVDGGAAIIQSQSGSIVNCQTSKIVNPLTDIFSVAYGGIITAHLVSLTDENNRTLFSQAKNTLTANGIIWSNI